MEERSRQLHALPPWEIRKLWGSHYKDAVVCIEGRVQKESHSIATEILVQDLMKKHIAYIF